MFKRKRFFYGKNNGINDVLCVPTTMVALNDRTLFCVDFSKENSDYVA